MRCPNREFKNNRSGHHERKEQEARSRCGGRNECGPLGTVVVALARDACSLHLASGREDNRVDLKRNTKEAVNIT